MIQDGLQGVNKCRITNKIFSKMIVYHFFHLYSYTDSNIKNYNI